MSAILAYGRSVIGSMGGIALDPGFIFKAERTETEGGSVTMGWGDPIPVFGMKDDVTEAMRQAAGYTDQDVRLILVRGALETDITSDDQVELYGKRWAISMVSEDPARGGWVMRGTPARLPV